MAPFIVHVATPSTIGRGAGRWGEALVENMGARGF
jgi:hypothetical protein